MDIKRELIDKGFVFLPEWNVNMSTLEVAKLVGSVKTLSTISGLEFITDVQTLSPKERSDKLSNQYSGHFGLDEFPLHSDLAYWSMPPKYLLLRCLKGFSDITTRILPVNLIIEDLMMFKINKAVVRPRNRKGSGVSCLLPLMFNVSNQRCYRWDSLFLEPVNSSAKRIKEYFEHQPLHKNGIEFNLIQPGDTLIINNWINLHGRSRVTPRSLGRVIERSYLNEIY